MLKLYTLSDFPNINGRFFLFLLVITTFIFLFCSKVLTYSSRVTVYRDCVSNKFYLQKQKHLVCRSQASKICFRKHNVFKHIRGTTSDFYYRVHVNCNVLSICIVVIQYKIKKVLKQNSSIKNRESKKKTTYHSVCAIYVHFASQH